MTKMKIKILIGDVIANGSRHLGTFKTSKLWGFIKPFSM
jgi:hypothetical protein